MGRDVRHPASRSYAGPGRWSHWLATALVLGLVASAVAAYRLDWGGRLGWGEDPTGDPAAVAPPEGLTLPDLPAVEPVAAPATGGALDAAEVTAAVTPGLGRRKDLGRHVVAMVAPAAGGEPVLASGTGAVVPASTTKLLTAAAALASLGPSARFTTSVVAGERPGDVVLVGGGDPFLASEPAEPGTYPERADVVALAAQVAGALPRRKVRLGYDASLFTGPADNPAWEPGYVPEGIVAPISALWVDEGRPADGYGRVADPARAAADAFAAGLREAGVRVVGQPRATVAPEGAAELGAVSSAPLSSIVQRVLDVSDNEAAEVLAHHVGLSVSGVGSFEAGAAGTLQVLSGLGVDVSGVALLDGSGLSRANLVTASTFTRVLQLASSPEHPELRAVVEGLPVAGFTGSLTYRFDKGAPEGRGRVRAKTGTLTGVHSLAGLVTDLDGNVMTFVVAADRVRPDKSLAARVALDEVAADLAACHCSPGPPVGATG